MPASVTRIAAVAAVLLLSACATTTSGMPVIGSGAPSGPGIAVPSAAPSAVDPTAPPTETTGTTASTAPTPTASTSGAVVPPTVITAPVSPTAPPAVNPTVPTGPGVPGSIVEPTPPRTTATSRTSSSPTRTIGQGVTKIDATTTTWFDTLCTGVAGISDLGDSLDPSGGSGSLTKVAGSLKSAAGQLSTTAGRLSSLPPPTFTGGAEYAGKAEAALTQFSGLLGTAADKISAGDPTGLTDLETAAESGPISDLENLHPAPELAAAVNRIPSCAKAKFTLN